MFHSSCESKLLLNKFQTNYWKVVDFENCERASTLVFSLLNQILLIYCLKTVFDETVQTVFEE